MKNWAAYVFLVLGFVIYDRVVEADRDGTGAIVGEGTVDAFKVRVGDCFNDSSSMDEVSDLPGVPCNEPHDNEAFALFDVTVENYPDGDAMGELAYSSCMERFESFVGRDYESSSLEIFTMYPSSESWQQNDREVVCAVYDMDANKLVGSVKDRSL